MFGIKNLIFSIVNRVEITSKILFHYVKHNRQSSYESFSKTTSELLLSVVASLRFGMLTFGVGGINGREGQACGARDKLRLKEGDWTTGREGGRYGEG